ncbi:regulator of replication initiation timing [Halarchaeum rubridurum]|nr:ATP-binding protein [Halarchaeum rubridurum]MBP1955060.1 regulator of replication initiation timing [Halarchaeum rubridurum]
MSQSQSMKALAEELLLERDTDQEVAELVHREFEGNPDAEWVALGQEENNYSIVENQQSEAMAALTELLTNSNDAVTLKNFYQRYGDSYSGDEFENTHEAAEELVDEDDAEITLTARGEPNGPFSLSIYDNGTGQPRERFESTFLNVLTPGKLKQEFNFLQGRYGMGSTGVLPFCGDRGFKLIISASYDEPEKWAWSLVRKNRDRTRYEYLIIDDEVPTFEGPINDKTYGSFVKCFEYQSEIKSEINQYFRRRLERYLVQSPLPIKLADERYDGYGGVYTKGLLPRLQDNRKFIQDVDEIEYTFDNDILGTKTIHIYLMKADDIISEEGLSEYGKVNFVRGRKHEKQAILFTLNGQTHGDQGQTFLKRRCNFNRVAKDALVVIDFSDINDADIVDLFKPSRDRLQSKEPAQVLKEELEEVVSENEMLRKEEQRRRNRMAKEDTEELEDDILEEILSKNPALKGYLKAGQKQPTIDTEGEKDLEYEGQFYPDHFEIVKKYTSRTNYDLWEGADGQYTKRIPENQESKQRFELNAEDDYLTRNTEPGEIKPSLPNIVKSVRLKDGILTLTLEPPEGAVVGHTMPLQLTVEPAQTGDGTLTRTIQIEITEPVEKEEKKPPQEEKQPNTQGFDFPDAYWVEKEEWDEHDFDEQSIVSVEPTHEGEMVLFINRDSAPLVNFIRRHNLRESGKEFVQRTYKLGIIFYSIGQYLELENEYGDDPAWEEVDLSTVIETTMKGVAQSLLEQTVSDDQLDKYTI